MYNLSLQQPKDYHSISCAFLHYLQLCITPKFSTLRSAHWPFRSMSSRNFWGTSRLWPAGRQGYWESAGSPKSCQVSHCKFKFIVIPSTKQLSFPLHMLQVNLIVSGFYGTGTMFSLGFLVFSMWCCTNLPKLLAVVVIQSKESNIVKSLQTGVFQCSNCKSSSLRFSFKLHLKCGLA